MNNKCIRLLADPVQIRDCKKSLQNMQSILRDIASVLNLAGNEVRLKIIFLLDQEREMCPCDLSDVLDMSVPAISQHLRKMKDGGIVKDRKVGQTIFYSIVENAKLVDSIMKSLVKEYKKELVS